MACLFPGVAKASKVMCAGMLLDFRSTVQTNPAPVCVSTQPILFDTLDVISLGRSQQTKQVVAMRCRIFCSCVKSSSRLNHHAGQYKHAHTHTHTHTRTRAHAHTHTHIRGSDGASGPILSQDGVDRIDSKIDDQTQGIGGLTGIRSVVSIVDAMFSFKPQ